MTKDGLTIIKNENYSLIIINDLTIKLTQLIKKNLSSICYGHAKSKTSRLAYAYKNTLNEFLERYNKKKKDTQKGMIGELLSHVLIQEYFPTWNTVSPYFNLEEKSIKKGFDLVLYSLEDKELWITEVKSGELHKDKDANATAEDLLYIAKYDLNGRLNEKNNTFWENAINGASIAFDGYKDVKDAVIDILGKISDSTILNQQKSTDRNVILISNLFSDLKDSVQETTPAYCYEKYKKENIFKKIFIISIQKGTYTKIFDFLVSESR